MIPVEFHYEAEVELFEAVSFYESRLFGLGSSFAAEIQSTVGLVREYPDVGSPLGRQLRRVVVGRFPYSIIYRREEERILVLAVAHQRRRPGYWKVRLIAR